MKEVWLLQKSGLLGGFVELSDRDFDEKGQATHVRLTVTEYDQLRGQILKAQNAAKEMEKQRRQDAEQFKKEISQIKSEARQIIEKSQKEIAAELRQAQEEKTYAENERAQLLEIMKNRANAKRGLKPKKKHPGYVVLRSEQFEFTHPVDRKSTETLVLWRTTVQSPIDIGIHEPEATHLIHEALMNEFGAKMGFEQIQIDKRSLSDNINAIDNKSWKNTVYLLDIKYRQNSKARLWEVTYIHNSAIVIPEDMCL